MKKPEEQLARVQEELEELKAEYQQYAYKVSHDLSAPFRQINGFAEILSKKHADSFDEKSLKHFNLIIKGAQKGASLLDGLLDFSRINTRAEDFCDTDCNNIIETVKEKLQPLISSTNAKIFYSSLPVIQADKKQILILFYHLLQNSLIYQEPSSKPEISIVSKNSHSRCFFCVEDNGIGIKPSQREDAFNILTRLVGDQEYPGAGMGLAIAKKIVKRHGGEIWIDESNGKTRVNFNIVSPI